MKKKKIKINLALGSGAARGLAHIGVLRALIDNDICIGALSGTSMGAIVSAFFAKYGSIGEIEEIAINITKKDTVKLLDLNLSGIYKGIFKGKKIYNFLKKYLGDVTFSQLKHPLQLCATDVFTGMYKIFENGKVLDAVMASISIPGVFPPYKVGDYYYIDGGISLPVPVKPLKDSCKEKVVAVNVIHKPSSRNRILMRMNKKNEKRKRFYEILELFSDIYGLDIPKNYKAPSIVGVLLQAFYTMEYTLASLNVKDADLAINLDLGTTNLYEFYNAKKIIEFGYEEAVLFINNNKLFFAP